MFAILLSIFPLYLSQRTCPQAVCHAGLGEDVCFFMEGADVASMMYHFSPCEGGKVCQFNRMHMTNFFNHLPTATLAVAEVADLYQRVGKCVDRENVIEGLLPGSTCDSDSQCRSNNCGDTCKGVGQGGACTYHWECDVGLFCNSLGVCQSTILKNQICDNATEVCETGYICSRFGQSPGSAIQTNTCLEIFSVDDDVDVTHAAACKGGFKKTFLLGDADDDCYTPTELTDGSGAIQTDVFRCPQVGTA